MRLLPLAVVAIPVFIVSWWLTGHLRRYALARRLLDVPNARSSHSVATPRGGGMAIVVSTLAAIVALGAMRLMPWSTVAALCGAGAAVAAIGFADDHGHIAPHWRLLGHFAAAWWLLTWIGGPPPLPLATANTGWLWQGLGALYLVWVLNLTNFMDGIDGIAAVEAITVGAGGAAIALTSRSGADAAMAPTALAAAAAGFLLWNWPPARIFMGDAGSGFIGTMMAGLSLQAGRTSFPALAGWIILLGVFVTDATVTLIRRAGRGERIHEPHRTHAYQHAAARVGRHKPVTLAVAAVNVVWLLPLAILVATARMPIVAGIVIAYGPLLFAAIWLGAGVPMPRTQTEARTGAREPYGR
jgi:Fuc2NAc and GlcNAc transferase